MINYNDLIKTKKIQNYSNFEGGVVAGTHYDKATQYIQAYLHNEYKVTNNSIDFSKAKQVFLQAGIVQATVNTQINLFKSKMRNNNINVTEQITLKNPLKNITDLNNFKLVAVLSNDNKVISITDKALYEDDSVVKVAIQLNNQVLVITDK